MSKHNRPDDPCQRVMAMSREYRSGETNLFNFAVQLDATDSPTPTEVSDDPPRSESERAMLSELEAVVERHLQSCTQVGMALLRIRDERLYRASFQSFQAYCCDRWGFGRRRADQLIQTVEIIADVAAGLPGSEVRTNVLTPPAVPADAPAQPTGAVPLPENEAQARALIDVPREQRPAVWQKAAVTGRDGRGASPGRGGRRTAE